MEQELQKKKKRALPKKDFLEQELESKEEIICIDKKRPKRSCTYERKKRTYSYEGTSPDRYLDKETGRKVKSAKATKMPAKLVYSW